MEYDGIPYRVIAPTAEIGEGTRIMPFVTVGAEAVIGGNCYIGHGCVIGEGAVIGDSCYIGNHVIISQGVHIRDNVFVGDNCVLGAGDRLALRERMVLKRIYLDIGTATNICSNCTIIGGTEKEQETVVGEKVFISDGCVIYEGTTIGSHTWLAPMVYAGLKSSIGEGCALTAQTIIGAETTVGDKVKAANRVIFKNKEIYPRGVFFGQKCILRAYPIESDMLDRKIITGEEL